LLLEINDHPSLNIFLEKDYMGGGMGKTLSKIDVYVKKTIIGDSIRLAKKKSSVLSDIERFRSLEKIYPNTEDPSRNVNDTLQTLRRVFYDLASLKQKSQITS
jgi:hypothetical protein